MRISQTDRQKADLAINVVALATRTERKLLLQPSRGEAHVSLARQVAMYLIHVTLGINQSKIGEVFGREKSTVGHAVRHIEDLRDCSGFDHWLEKLDGALLAQVQLGDFQCDQQVIRYFPGLGRGEAVSLRH